MTATRLPKLTKIEREIFTDRLQLPDCLTDYICGDTGISEEDVLAAIEAIQSGGLMRKE